MPVKCRNIVLSLLASSAGCSLIFDANPGAAIDGGGASDASRPSLDGGICNWSFHRSLAISGEKLETDLDDFPVLVVLDASRFDYGAGRADGRDLRFAAGRNELAYEVDTWDPEGTSLVWVKVPLIKAGTGAEFFMLYGNPEADDGEDSGGTWSNDYAAVWHLGDDLLDSTAYGNDALDVGGTQPSVGTIGMGREFDGTSNYLAVSSAASIDDLTDFSYSAWMLPESGGDREILSKGSSNRELRLRETSPNTILRGCVSHITTNACTDTKANFIQLSTWQNLAMSFDGASDSQAHLFIDGGEAEYDVQSTGSGNPRVDASSDLNIGRRSNGSRYFDGTLDEIRISAVTRSKDWILASVLAARDELIVYGQQTTNCE